MMKMNARQLGNTRLAMLNKPRELATRAEFAEDIRRNWLNALEATVQVGRRLKEAKENLPHGEYEAMVEQDLLFKPATARKLREVATFVDSGKVPLEQLPEAYSTVYAIATMPEERRQEALDQGVIRSGVTRRELEQFNKSSPFKPSFSTHQPLCPLPAEQTFQVGTGLLALSVSKSETTPALLPNWSAMAEPMSIDVKAEPARANYQPEPVEDEPPLATVVGLMTELWCVDNGKMDAVIASRNGATIFIIKGYPEANTSKKSCIYAG